MFDRRWTKLIRDLTTHRLRTTLVVLSIAVGIFAVGVVMGGRGILVREFDEDFTTSTPASAQFMTEGLDAAVVRDVERRPDVRYADGRRRVAVRFTAEESPSEGTVGWPTMRLWAIPDFAAIRVQKIGRQSAASWPPGPGEIVLESGALQVEDFAIGDMITVEGPSGTRAPMRVVGFAHDINAYPAKFTSAITGFVSMESMDALDEPRDLNSMAVLFSKRDYTRGEASRMAADIRDTELASAGVRVVRTEVPEPGSHFFGDIFKAVSLLLLALGVLSLGLSAFLVVTTVSAIMAQQARQVGIMKAVGARTGQVTGMYLGLVVAYGLLAVAVALPAGLLAGRAFAEYGASVLNFRIVDYTPPLWVFVLEVGVGVLIPVAAAMVPIALGTKTPVAHALAATGISSSFGKGLIDRALGTLRGLPRPVALSLRNTFLRKGRLLLTLTTLALASAVVMSVLSARASMLKTVDDMSSWWRYDAQAILAQPAPASLVEREAESVDGVTAVETWVESQASLSRPDGTENESLFAIGLPPKTGFITPSVVAGRWLREGEADAVVVNTDITKEEKWIEPGDTIRLDIRGTEKEWKVVGIVTGQLMGPVAYMPSEALDSAMAAEGAVGRVLVQTSEHTAEAQRRAADQLDRKLDGAGVVVADTLTQTKQAEDIAGQFGILVVFLVIMASLLALVGVIGLIGTMSINVLESVREIGVMRATGAGHAAIFSIFITEGVVVALMAWAIGAVVSWPLSVFLVNALGVAMSLPLSYAFSYVGVLAWLAGVVLIAVLASIVPAWNASRVSVRDAIAYE
ncbi:MAG: ABC transporter permease [Coriobacteriales bacterium]|nr:ABC transporter permease [Coriobacteriales bacterium]